MAAVAADAAAFGRARFHRHSAVRADTFRNAATTGAVFVAAAKRSVESVAKSEPGRSGRAELVTLGKIQRRSASGKKTRWPDADPASAAAKENAEQRSAASLLYER